MTMPHLMNCPHRGDGWCLDCVKDLQQRVRELEGQAWHAEQVGFARIILCGVFRNEASRCYQVDDKWLVDNKIDVEKFKNAVKLAREDWDDPQKASERND